MGGGFHMCRKDCEALVKKSRLYSSSAPYQIWLPHFPSSHYFTTPNTVTFSAFEMYYYCGHTVFRKEKLYTVRKKKD